MRMQIENYDDLDDIDDFSFERSPVLRRLLDDYRRDEHSDRVRHHHENFRNRRHQVDWDWGDFEDWD